MEVSGVTPGRARNRQKTPGESAPRPTETGKKAIEWLVGNSVLRGDERARVMVEIRRKGDGVLLLRFQGPTLAGQALCSEDLRRADMRGMDLRGIVMRDTYLGEADLRGADISDSYLHRADLTGADLSGARLNAANFSSGNLRHANFTGAVMAGADLCGANLYRADLTGADLTGALLFQTHVTEAALIGANLRKADLTSAIFLRALLTNADFREAILQETSFADCASLAAARGLAEVVHAGPSSLDLRTLRAVAGTLPEAFLSGAGNSRAEITRLGAALAA
jgi:uncharacterized protein YjbI with pentapeptide repeats